MPELHPVASEHTPIFFTAPGETDTLFVVCALLLLLGAVGLGILFWRIHALPEQLAHRNRKLQYELCAVLALISLFTHEHIYWIIALVLAFIDLPDFSTPLNRLAGSAEKMAGIAPQAVGPLPEVEAAGVNQNNIVRLVPSETNGGANAGAPSPGTKS